ncbi:hypothetical protein [Bacteroides gallinarum]|uniref:hypothetical protein n=1 Tax=Bacteroides gallinarum TaxID=376806 RepID=UPI0012B562FD|nr:hypothetical protein [Bacteroides gallinarum]
METRVSCLFATEKSLQHGYLSDDILVDAIKYMRMAREKGRMILSKKWMDCWQRE